MPLSHPTDAELLDYLNGQTAGAGTTRVEDHLGRCTECCERAEMLTKNTPLHMGLRELGDWQNTIQNAKSGFSSSDERQQELEESPTAPDGYQLIEKISEGGNGVVFEAFDERLERKVALKFAKGPGLSKTGLMRFRREANLAASLRHPNIVQIHDVLEHNERPCISMELIPGGSLAQLIKERQHEVRDAVQLVLHTARAVHHAHTRGVIHRDIKPANILLETNQTSSEKWSPKVTDFGLARREDSDVLITQVGTLVGTPAYMAPEQIEGHEVSAAADVYSLGCVLYELLTYRTPFTAKNTREQMRMVLEKTPKPARRIVASVPIDLDTVCHKCLEKLPESRYGSAAELADDLERFLNGFPVGARRVGLLESAIKACRRHPITAFLTSAMLLVVFAAAGVILAQWRESIQTNKTLVDSNKKLETKTSELETKTLELSAARSELSDKLTASRVREEEALFERAIRLAESGDVAQGMLWMGEAFRLSQYHSRNSVDEVATDRSYFQEMLRLNLAAWEPYIARHKFSYSTPPKGHLATSDGRFLFGYQDGALHRWRTDRDESEAWLDSDGQQIKAGLSTISQSGNVLLLKNDSGAFVRFDNNTRKRTGTFPKMQWGTSMVLIVGEAEDRILCLSFSNEKVRIELLSSHQSEPIAQREFRGLHPHSAPSMQLSPDGTMVLVQVSNERHILRASDLQEFGDIAKGTPSAPDVFGADSKGLWLATSSTRLSLLDTQNQAITREVSVRPYCEWHRMSADGRTLLSLGSGGNPERLDVWANSRQSLLATTANVLPVGDTRVLVDSRHIFELPDRVLRIRSRSGGGATGRPTRLRPSFDLNGSAYFDRSKSKALLISGGIGKLVDPKTGNYCGQPIHAEPRTILHVGDVSPNGKIAATGTWAKQGVLPSNFSLWDTATGKSLFGPLEHTNYVSAIAFSPDSKLAAVGDFSGKVRLWDTATGKQIAEPLLHHDIVMSLCFDADGKHLAVGLAHDHNSTPGSVVWNLNSRKESPFLRETMDSRKIRFASQQGVLLTLAGTLQAWDWRSGELLWRSNELIGQFVENPVRNSIVAATDDGRMMQLDILTGEPVGGTMSQGWSAKELDVHPNGRFLASGGIDGTARFWDLNTAKPIGPPVVHPDPIAAVSFSPNGETLYTVSQSLTTKSAIPEPYPRDAGSSIARLRKLTAAEIRDHSIVPVKIHGEELENSGNSKQNRFSSSIARFAETDDDWFGAEFYLKRLLQETPEDWTLFARHARTKERLGDFEAATHSYTEAESLLGDAKHQLVDWYKHEALEMQREDKWERAIWYMDKVIAAERDDWFWFAERSIARAQQGLQQESDEDQAKAILLSGDKFYAFRFIEYYMAKAEWELARNAAAATFALSKNDVVLARSLVLLHYKSNRLAELGPILAELSELENTLGEFPDDTFCNIITWTCAIGDADRSSLQRMRDRLQAFVSETQNSEKLAAWHNTLSLVHYRLGEMEQAIESCKSAIQEAGLSTEWESLIMAAAYHALGDEANCQEWLEQADAEPETPPTVWEGIELELLRGLIEKSDRNDLKKTSPAGSEALPTADQ